MLASAHGPGKSGASPHGGLVVRHRRHIATASCRLRSWLQAWRCQAWHPLRPAGHTPPQARQRPDAAIQAAAGRCRVLVQLRQDQRRRDRRLRPQHHSLRLAGHWLTARGADGRRNAVELRTRSEAVITRSTPLIPGDRGFAVAMTVKINQVVGNDTPNLAQLGYYRDPGQWKIEVLPSSGQVRCRIKGPSGTGLVISKRGIIDGKFHTVVCYRLHGQIGIAVDGHAVQQHVHIGTIASTRQVHIGNKDLKGSSDQVHGVVDYFSIALGARPVARATAAAPALH